MKTAVLLFCLFASALPARLDAESRNPPSAKKQPAYFRVRAFLMEEKQPISVALQQPNLDPVELLSAPNGESIISIPYEEMPAKEIKLTVRIGSESFDVNAKLDEGIYYTLLIYRESGRLLTPLLQDTFADPADPDCHIRVFNFGSERTAILTFRGQNAKQFAPNTFTEFTLPSRGKLKIDAMVPDPSGGYPAKSSTEINTNSVQAFSVIIVPDYRGKFRPRIWIDGPTP